MHLGGEEGGVEGVTRASRYHAHRKLESRPPVWPGIIIIIRYNNKIIITLILL